jgi:DNA anti-recombination protein RmuC
MNPLTTPYTIVNLSSVVEILSITLSVIALTITIIGFFASLKFYRDGVQLQDNANKALVVLGEKTQHIQSQVGDMFSKTLDAAIGQRNQISESFDHINKQLEKSAKEIVDNAIKQVGIAGDNERVRLSEIVNKHMEPLRKKINATRESAEELTINKTLIAYGPKISYNLLK